MRKKITYKTTLNSLERSILDVVKYYDYFSYPPSFEEIYTFLSIKVTRKQLQSELQRLLSKKRLSESEINIENIKKTPYIQSEKRLKNTRYTLGGHSMLFDVYIDRTINSVNKLQILYKYTSVINYMPSIKLVGLSGSLSMLHAKKTDDIDICIVCTQNRMWTTRILTSLIAQLMGLRRKRTDTTAENKVCLNLFFDEKNLLIPYQKNTKYVGHELFQMKPIINKDHTYERMVEKNNWVYGFFPNARSRKFKDIDHSFQQRATIIGDVFEFFSKIFQLFLINRHKTSEIITDTQLWFFPRDFEKKIKRNII